MMRDAKPKKKKPSFLTRLVNRGREAKALGHVLVNEPRQFPNEAIKLTRRSLRTIWDARGGGLYACGFLVTFLFLEVRMFIIDIYSAESVGNYFSGQVSDMLFKYLGQSFQNTISAFLWPIYIIDLHPVWGGGLLAAMFVIFPRFLKKPLEMWLFNEIGKDQAQPPDAL
jgi:hypothetical protein